MSRALIVRGDHEGVGNIIVETEADGRFSFYMVASTDSVEMKVKCGCSMNARALAKLGAKLTKMSVTKARSEQ